jgi:hypothetical protein
MISEGKRLRAAREADLKRRDRATLKRLAERLKHAKHERAHAKRQIAHYCRLGRQNVAARVRALRAEMRQAVNEKADAMRKAQRDRCAADQSAAALELWKGIDTAHRELEQERQSFRHNYGKKKTPARAVERRAESDDEVRRNLPPELVAVFDRMKTKIKAGPRHSRTEAFLEWVERNPDEAAGMLYEQAERDVARMVAQHERIGRRLKKGRRAYEDPAERAHALAGVPF